MASRDLQVATLGNEGVSDSDQTAYIIPYVIAILTGLGILSVALQYAWWWVCKHVFGREDPIDMDQVMKNLTVEQRELVLKHILKVGEVEGTDWLSKEVEEDDESEREQGDSFIVHKDETDTTHEEEVVVLVASGVEGPKDQVVMQCSIASKKPGGDIEAPEREGDDRPVCPICIGRLCKNDNAIFQPRQCSHRFHGRCILEWLSHSTNSNNDCPVCRAKVVSDEEMRETTLHLLKSYDGWDELGKDTKPEATSGP